MVSTIFPSTYRSMKKCGASAANSVFVSNPDILFLWAGIAALYCLSFSLSYRCDPFIPGKKREGKSLLERDETKEKYLIIYKEKHTHKVNGFADSLPLPSTSYCFFRFCSCVSPKSPDKYTIILCGSGCLVFFFIYTLCHQLPSFIWPLSKRKKFPGRGKKTRKQNPITPNKTKHKNGQ